MSTRGSEPSLTRLVLPAWVTALLVALGMAGMLIGALAAQRAGFGLRAILVSSEAGLVLPSLLAVLVAGIPLLRGLGFRATALRVVLLSLLAGASLWMVSIGLMTLQS